MSLNSVYISINTYIHMFLYIWCIYACSWLIAQQQPGAAALFPPRGRTAMTGEGRRSSFPFGNNSAFFPRPHCWAAEGHLTEPGRPLLFKAALPRTPGANSNDVTVCASGEESRRGTAASSRRAQLLWSCQWFGNNHCVERETSSAAEA